MNDESRAGYALILSRAVKEAEEEEANADSEYTQAREWAEATFKNLTLWKERKNTLIDAMRALQTSEPLPPVDF